MSEQKCAKERRADPGSVMADVIEGAELFDELIDSEFTKCKAAEDILLQMRFAVESIRKGAGAILEMNGDYEEGDENVCQRCPNCPRN